MAMAFVRWYLVITILATLSSLLPRASAFSPNISLHHKMISQTASCLGESNSPDDDGTTTTASPGKRPLPLRRAFLLSSLLAGTQLLFAQAYAPPGFQRIPTQFLAALGDPSAKEGVGAHDWGLWEVDPGPRGVWLRNYESQLKGKRAPAGWTFDPNDWWLEEHGLIMEAPTFPVPPGKYLVTGGRLVTTVLTIDNKGKWNLEEGKLYDVTHLPCRSARYTPTASDGGSPLTARQSDFPVAPGAEMPAVSGCNKQDYAVLFVIGKQVAAEL